MPVHNITFACEDCGSNDFAVRINPQGEVYLYCIQCGEVHDLTRSLQWLQDQMKYDIHLDSIGAL